MTSLWPWGVVAIVLLLGALALDLALGAWRRA